MSDEFKAEIKEVMDAEDDKEGAKEALIEGYEGEGGHWWIETTMESPWHQIGQVEAMVSGLRLTLG